MARLFGDQRQQEQLQVVAGELAPGAEARAFKSAIVQVAAEKMAEAPAAPVLAHMAHGMAHFAGHAVAEVTEKST